MVDTLKGKLDELIQESSSEKVLNLTTTEYLKGMIKYLPVVILYFVLTLISNEMIDLGEIVGIVFSIITLALVTILWFDRKKQKQLQEITWKQHKKELQQMAKTTVEAVDIVGKDLEETFKATIDAYQQQITSLILDVLDEKTKLHTFMKSGRKKKI